MRATASWIFIAFMFMLGLLVAALVDGCQRQQQPATFHVAAAGCETVASDIPWVYRRTVRQNGQCDKT
jgi:hypothetical protein